MFTYIVSEKDLGNLDSIFSLSFIGYPHLRTSLSDLFALSTQ